jgi:hypothetical protein
MSYNLNAEQRKAHSASYRNHQMRMFRFHQRADGAQVLIVKYENLDNPTDPRVGKAVLLNDVVTVEFFDPTISSFIRDEAHFAECVLATLKVYRHAGRPLRECFEFEFDEDGGSSSLPLFIAEPVAA